jgi:hypothetical protein
MNYVILYEYDSGKLNAKTFLLIHVEKKNHFDFLMFIPDYFWILGGNIIW